jgi:hypothetical protein
MLDKAIHALGLTVGIGVLGCNPPEQSPATPQTPSSVAKKPAAAMFGRPDENGRWLRLREVQFLPGKTFGWRIRLPCLQPVEYTEVMKLPAKGDFTFDPQELRETTISPDGTVATTHDYAACIDGWIEHSWSLAEHDPPGMWEISVAIPGWQTQVWKVRFVK